MLKIVFDATGTGGFVLRLEGRVIGPWVEELRRSCERALTNTSRTTLDFANVSFVDRDGVALVRSLRRRQVALVNCSPFVTEQLKAATSADEPAVEGADDAR
jgi:anti-anti-sigma regulatory factor